VANGGLPRNWGGFYVARFPALCWRSS